MDESPPKAPIQMNFSLAPHFEETMDVQVQVQVNEEKAILILREKDDEPKPTLALCYLLSLNHTLTQGRFKN